MACAAATALPRRYVAAALQWFRPKWPQCAKVMARDKARELPNVRKVVVSGQSAFDVICHYPALHLQSVTIDEREPDSEGGAGFWDIDQRQCVMDAAFMAIDNLGLQLQSLCQQGRACVLSAYYRHDASPVLRMCHQAARSINPL